MGTIFKAISGILLAVVILALAFLSKTQGINPSLLLSLLPSVIACAALFSLGSLYDKYDTLKRDLDEIRESISDLTWEHMK